VAGTELPVEGGGAPAEGVGVGGAPGSARCACASRRVLAPNMLSVMARASSGLASFRAVVSVGVAVSSNTAFIESAAGVGGGRTRLACVVTALLFLCATFLAPLVAVVPAAGGRRAVRGGDPPRSSSGS